MTNAESSHRTTRTKNFAATVLLTFLMSCIALCGSAQAALAYDIDDPSPLGYKGYSYGYDSDSQGWLVLDPKGNVVYDLGDGDFYTNNNGGENDWFAYTEFDNGTIRFACPDENAYLTFTRPSKSNHADISPMGENLLVEFANTEWTDDGSLYDTHSLYIVDYQGNTVADLSGLCPLAHCYGLTSTALDMGCYQIEGYSSPFVDDPDLLFMVKPSTGKFVDVSAEDGQSTISVVTESPFGDEGEFLFFICKNAANRTMTLYDQNLNVLKALDIPEYVTDIFYGVEIWRVPDTNCYVASFEDDDYDIHYVYYDENFDAVPLFCQGEYTAYIKPGNSLDIPEDAIFGCWDDELGYVPDDHPVKVALADKGIEFGAAITSDVRDDNWDSISIANGSTFTVRVVCPELIANLQDKGTIAVYTLNADQSEYVSIPTRVGSDYIEYDVTDLGVIIIGASPNPSAAQGGEAGTIAPFFRYVDISNYFFVYNGKVKKPTVTVKSNHGTLLQEGVDYKLAYKGNRKNIGRHEIKITGIGDYAYCGDSYASFHIMPKATSISKVTGGKKKFTVKWKKSTSTNASGYEIIYGTDKNLMNSKSVKVKKASAKSKTIKVKKAGTYYVQVYVYKKTSDGNYYSAPSKVKKVKVK